MDKDKDKDKGKEMMVGFSTAWSPPQAYGRTEQWGTLGIRDIQRC
jgi:hypothetical protein